MVYEDHSPLIITLNEAQSVIMISWCLWALQAQPIFCEPKNVRRLLESITELKKGVTSLIHYSYSYLLSAFAIASWRLTFFIPIKSLINHHVPDSLILLPNLSIWHPHFGQVQPPHISCWIFFGILTAGKCSEHLGQLILFRLILNLFESMQQLLVVTVIMKINSVNGCSLCCHNAQLTRRFEAAKRQKTERWAVDCQTSSHTTF